MLKDSPGGKAIAFYEADPGLIPWHSIKARAPD